MVWSAYASGGTGDIDVYATRSIPGSLIVNLSNSSGAYYPQIDGGQVVWTRSVWQGSFGYPQVFLYDLNQGGWVVQLTNGTTSNTRPQIDQGQVVWTEQDGQDHAVNLYDLNQGGPVVQLAATTTPIHGLQIDDGQVVWYCSDGQDSEIYFAVYKDANQQIGEVEDFFDEAVADGTLLGSGPGRSAAGRLGALDNMLAQVEAYIEQGDTAAAVKLQRVYDRCDGQARPPDFVGGSAASELASLVQEFIDELSAM